MPDFHHDRLPEHGGVGGKSHHVLTSPGKGRKSRSHGVTSRRAALTGLYPNGSALHQSFTRRAYLLTRTLMRESRMRCAGGTAMRKHAVVFAAMLTLVAGAAFGGGMMGTRSSAGVPGWGMMGGGGGYAPPG